MCTAWGQVLSVCDEADLHQGRNVVFLIRVWGFAKFQAAVQLVWGVVHLRPQP